MKSAIELQTHLLSAIEDILDDVDAHVATGEGEGDMLNAEMDKAIQKRDASELRRYIEDARAISERMGYCRGAGAAIKKVSAALQSFFEDEDSN